MTIDTTIKKWIDIDVSCNFTPDLPSMRYFGGGIPIFLWDDLQDYAILKNTLGEIAPIADNLEIRHPAARTVRKYRPWYNLMPDLDYYASYCLEEQEDVDFLSLQEYTVGSAMQMEGKVCFVTLAALQEIDAYYENETNFDRTRIKVYPSKFYTHPMECYTWFNNVDQLCEFDNISNEYVLRDGIDPVPYRDTLENTYAY